jgi:hypothetical protein
LIPDDDEILRLDFRQLVDRLTRISVTELESLDPDLLMDENWPLLDEEFRESFVRSCNSLSGDEWRHCDELAEKLFGWFETFGGFSHTSVIADRFHLSASLMLEAAPRSDVALLDPARLLRDFLSEFPYSPEEARQVVSGWGTQPNIDEFRMLANPLSLLNSLKRVEHLFVRSKDRATYEEWKQLNQKLLEVGA